MILRVSAAAAAGVLFVTGMVLHDFESVAIAALLVAGGLLLRLRGGLLGRVLLLVLFIDVLGWMAPAAWSNAVHGGALSTLAVPMALSALCVAGVASAVKVPERVVAFGTITLAAVALIAASVGQSTNDTNVPAASGRVISIRSSGAKFSTSKLTATGSRVTVVFHNKDLFWHTFTIDKLNLSVKAPLGGTRVERFTAPPGTYQFYCAIPGHKSAGMKGTLVVTAS
ncbi:MAG: hypothetical protein QOJ00_2072 [Actinomycetota bacterium]|jgi:uncharacterized cupredoxin-like copper-binding protein